jgi:signal transduction histidine kinase
MRRAVSGRARACAEGARAFDLHDVVLRAVEDFRPSFLNAGVGLDLEVSPTPVPVSADRTRMAQILEDLLQNAVRFTRRGRKTRVCVGTEGGVALIRVVDDNVGMDAATLTRPFEPFMQVSQSLDRSMGGLGLGLTLVRNLVELRGGRIAAWSAGLDQGTPCQQVATG